MLGIFDGKNYFYKFCGIRALAKVNESSVMIEEYMRDVLGDPDFLEIMNKEEKLQIFGSIFSRCPSKFKLSPGHKVTFQILSDCKEIVQRWTIICKVKPRQSMGVPSERQEQLFSTIVSHASHISRLVALFHRKADAHIRLTSLGSADNIVYPRHIKNQERYGSLSEETYLCDTLPSLDEIKNTMEKARVDAKMELEALGVCLGDSDDKIFNFDARLAFKLSESLEAPAPTDDDAFEFDECEEVACEGEDTFNFIDSYEKSLLKSIEGAQLTDYSSLLESRLIKYCEKEKPVRDTDQEILSSPFIVITREDGAVVTFKKQTIVWLCENGVKKQSNDRLKRAITQSSNFLLAQKLIINFSEKRKIRIGDWCMFKSDVTGRGQIKNFNIRMIRIQNALCRKFSDDYTWDPNAIFIIRL
ncbi:hypothetical protein DAPPUDRAFT_334896 [Daphnia pulex]|uniref:Uncharacterized protein n=1 Tax=Daphnia pulex TaxID=6669 RepID=E9HWM1_DAPPU|nr:hypothetical protein DAPPUDRAFT_334896 [Daphnia pulex]|eukprot:EFX63864.1 hypothetical protein DAPPUDRAFT_334896 [Daphnia pulex]